MLAMPADTAPLIAPDTLPAEGAVFICAAAAAGLRHCRRLFSLSHMRRRRQLMPMIAAMPPCCHCR